MDSERIKFLKLIFIEIKIYYNNLKLILEVQKYKGLGFNYNINIIKLNILKNLPPVNPGILFGGVRHEISEKYFT